MVIHEPAIKILTVASEHSIMAWILYRTHALDIIYHSAWVIGKEEDAERELWHHIFLEPVTEALTSEIYAFEGLIT